MYRKRPVAWNELRENTEQKQLFGRFCALRYSYIEGILTSLSQRNFACQFQLANSTVLKEVVKFLSGIFERWNADGTC